MSRKPGIVFQPEQVIDYVSHPDKDRPTEELARVYCEVSIVFDKWVLQNLISWIHGYDVSRNSLETKKY